MQQRFSTRQRISQRVFRHIEQGATQEECLTGHCIGRLRRPLNFNVKPLVNTTLAFILGTAGTAAGFYYSFLGVLALEAPATIDGDGANCRLEPLVVVGISPIRC